MKQLLKKGGVLRSSLQYWWTALYLPVYMVFFVLAEEYTKDNFQIINIPFDDRIPFIEWFIFPYYVWFPFMAFVFLWFFFRDKSEYIRMFGLLSAGMTLFLIISFVWPNGLDLRPEVLPRDNIATRLVAGLYATDTPTNVFPSIHVYNTLGGLIAIWHSKRSGLPVGVKWAATVLGVSIILATVFLKQHSILDGLAAFVLAGLMYALIYRGTAKKNA